MYIMYKSCWQWGVEYADHIFADKCPGYDFKPSNGKALVQALSVMQSALSLALLSGSLWPGVVVPVSIGQIELFSLLLGIIISFK